MRNCGTVSFDDRLPILDLSGLGDESRERDLVARVSAACREVGFFYLVGHGVDASLGRDLEIAAREFFALPEQEKAEISMERGGRAWRGFFPVGAELTSGRPDQKEGLYLGSELSPDDARVLAGTPLHGPNLFPRRPARLAPLVRRYLDELTGLGHRVMEAVALSLDLDRDAFRRSLTADPTVLLRIFHYPPLEAVQAEELWSVGEHTDYGLLTLLAQDSSGGLEVRTVGGEWMPAPPVEGSFVCNLGDMLERMTGGLYRSTPHRVRNTSGRSRISIPFFFDPGWDAEAVAIVPGAAVRDDPAARWDGRSPHAFEGRYGDYLMSKVGKVFPQLREDVLR